MNLDIELATTEQIADELRKREQPFILIIGNPSSNAVMDMGLFMSIQPDMAVGIMEQITEIVRKIAED